MNLQERIAKAESLDKDVRDKYLFEYLRLKSLEKEFDNEIKFKALAELISFADENFEISTDNLLNFIDDFEKDYRTSNKFNDYIFYLFVAYVLDNRRN